MKKTRIEAAKAGEKYYFTGKPCKNGHTAKRQTITGACYGCIRDNQKKQRAKIKAMMDKAIADKE